MEKIETEEMIEKINEMFKKTDEVNSKTKKEEIDDLKNLKKYLEEEFPIEEESIKKGK